MINKTMSYEIALNKAWEELAQLNAPKINTVKFLADEYTVDLGERKVFSLACNVAAKDFTAILILHYLAVKLKGLPQLSNEWLDFKEISRIEGYQSAFMKRAVEPIIRKYGNNPEGLLSFLDRLHARKADQGDVGIIVEAFERAPVLITLWKADEEFGPDANILFDRSITRIFCMEDIVVLAGLVAAGL